MPSRFTLLTLLCLPSIALAQINPQIEKITSCLQPAIVIQNAPPPCVTLAQRMEQLHIPGVSIAVLEHGKIVWARGFGVQSLGGPPVTPETRFQAGSISKPLAAMAALHQVQLGKLALDEDVNTKLTSWKIPESPAANGKPVTLRELLTHTAGFTVHGFPGYASNAPVPTLVQVLNGEKPANTPAIRIETEPGTKWNYSGGGFTVMQQLVLDVTHSSFPDLLQKTVLTPIGLTHSTYQQPLPDSMKSTAATPYDGNGAAIPGGAHTYPEMAAAGLWTTPSDLALYCLEVEHSLNGKANHVLNPDLTKQMLTPGLGKWGLGLQIGGSDSDPYFAHGGDNAGFSNFFAAYRDREDGAMIMTNAQAGGRLADELIRSIASTYGWPDFKPVVKTTVKLDPAGLARFTGTYKINPTANLVVTVEGDHLITQVNGQDKVPVYPESPTSFFPTLFPAQLDFIVDDKGAATTLVLHQGPNEIKAPKQ